MPSFTPPRTLYSIHFKFTLAQMILPGGGGGAPSDVIGGGNSGDVIGGGTSRDVIMVGGGLCVEDVGVEISVVVDDTVAVSAVD